jgi:hypothetical protein
MKSYFQTLISLWRRSVLKLQRLRNAWKKADANVALVER